MGKRECKGVTLERPPTLELVERLKSESNDQQIIVGDLHGNTLKLIWILLAHGIVSGIKAEDYQRLVAIYIKSAGALSKEDLVNFSHILDDMKFSQASSLHFIGDMLADRGSNDWFTLKVLEKLKENNVGFTIDISNHDFEMIEASERVRLGKLPRLKPLYMSKADGALCSMENLQTLIDKELVTRGEIQWLMQTVYNPALKVIDYSQDCQGRMTIYSHAPIGMKTIKALAKKFEVTFEDSESSTGLAKTIDAINDKFHQYVIENSVHKLKNTPNKLTADSNLLKAENAQTSLEYVMWNRGYEGLDRNTDVDWVHGHDSVEEHRRAAAAQQAADSMVKSSRHIICVDNFFGKGLLWGNTYCYFVAPRKIGRDLSTSLAPEKVKAARTEAARKEAARTEAARRSLDLAEASLLVAIEKEAARKEAARKEAAVAGQTRAAATPQAVQKAIQVAVCLKLKTRAEVTLAKVALEAFQAETVRAEVAVAEQTRAAAAAKEAREAEAAYQAADQAAAAKEVQAAIAAVREAEAAVAVAQAAQAEAARKTAQVETVLAGAKAAYQAACEAAYEAAVVAGQNGVTAEAAALIAAVQEAADRKIAEVATVRAEAARAEAARKEAARAEAARKEAARKEAARKEAARAEAARKEAARAEAARKEAARAEAARFRKRCRLAFVVGVGLIVFLTILLNHFVPSSMVSIANLMLPVGVFVPILLGVTVLLIAGGSTIWWQAHNKQSAALQPVLTPPIKSSALSSTSSSSPARKEAALIAATRPKIGIRHRAIKKKDQSKGAPYRFILNCRIERPHHSVEV